ncbi:MAG: peptide-methionine (S)-S-oxide reductase MsrA [Waddliaceae bacterium]
MLYFLVIAAVLLISFQLLADPAKGNVEQATFAGGCFWCMEPVFDDLEGVVKTTVGYSGGETKNPSYKEVSSGKTGHAESIQIDFDPTKIRYEELLDHFWKNIDPTVKDQQFCDKGNQYRSAIFYHNEKQKQLAERSKEQLIRSQRFDHIFTEISPASTFYPAEDYHQKYYKKNPYRYKIYRYLCGRDQRLNQLWNH